MALSTKICDKAAGGLKTRIKIYTNRCQAIEAHVNVQVNVHVNADQALSFDFLKSINHRWMKFDLDPPWISNHADDVRVVLLVTIRDYFRLKFWSGACSIFHNFQINFNK